MGNNNENQEKRKLIFRPFFLEGHLKADFEVHGHNLDTKFRAIKKMKPPSEPKIDKRDENVWFIYWNHDVPHSLWHLYPRTRIRIKKYDNLNNFRGEEREKNAEFRRQVWKYNLEVEKYSPFTKELARYNRLISENKVVEEKVETISKLVVKRGKGDTPLMEALDLFIKSRQRNQNKSTVSTYRSTVKWLKNYFIDHALVNICCWQLTRDHIAEAALYMFDKGTWGSTKYNNEVSTAMVVLNWLAREGYIKSNPAAGKIEKMPEHSSIHEWYDKKLADTVKKELLETCMPVYLASAFTYYSCVRSSKELMKLKVDDIDRELKRVRFRKELSKNKREAYRDYPDGFERILDLMNFNELPADWFLFGSGGEPGPKAAGKNTLSNLYRPIKEKLGLSIEYTIYGWKHTRVVHEMMKGADPYTIQYICRHSDLTTTMKYMRNFDFNLKKSYDSEDLTF